MDNGKKIGFIGFGNMAQAIAKGLLEAKVCKAEQLYACAAHFEKLKDTRRPAGCTPDADCAGGGAEQRRGDPGSQTVSD